MNVAVAPVTGCKHLWMIFCKVQPVDTKHSTFNIYITTVWHCGRLNLRYKPFCYQPLIALSAAYGAMRQVTLIVFLIISSKRVKSCILILSITAASLLLIIFRQHKVGMKIFFFSQDISIRLFGSIYPEWCIEWWEIIWPDMISAHALSPLHCALSGLSCWNVVTDQEHGN